MKWWCRRRSKPTPASISRLPASQPQQYEITIHNRQGDKIFLDITNMPIYVNGEITGVHGQARNRTLERRNEDWLKILERGIEASSNGITIADATASGFPLVYVNPAFQRITGYSRDDVLGQNCWQLRGPDTNDKAMDTIREALADFREVHTSILHYRKDGKAFWNDLYIAPVRNHRTRSPTSSGCRTTSPTGFTRKKPSLSSQS